ncbi:hypothetical protein FDF74_04210 [Clostridium niameyense]|uniref:Uncharacterized protein n=1 Tax=Clostridium niameyense TaxID=1622073 RepID=A0A6M0R9G7_9CLOT|nr:hypothetical protein [Clostridium niameyense]
MKESRTNISKLCLRPFYHESYAVSMSVDEEREIYSLVKSPFVFYRHIKNYLFICGKFVVKLMLFSC